jgi:hypothetical protein
MDAAFFPTQLLFINISEKPKNYLRDIPGSNLDPETGYPDGTFHGFLHSLEEIPRYYLKLGHYRFPAHTFQIITH